LINEAMLGFADIIMEHGDERMKNAMRADRARYQSSHRLCRSFGRRGPASAVAAACFMKIKLDENVPATLASLLSGLGHDPDTVPREGLAGKADQDVSRLTGSGAVSNHARPGFLRHPTLAPGTHHGILLVRLADPSRNSLIECIRDTFRTEDVTNWPGCFVVLTDRKIRIQRP
jgi:hypothetical protein